MHLVDCTDETISGMQFVNIANVAIIIERCNNVTITANDFSNVVGGIYVLDSTNVTITWNRYEISAMGRSVPDIQTLYSSINLLVGT